MVWGSGCIGFLGLCFLVCVGVLGFRVYIIMVGVCGL